MKAYETSYLLTYLFVKHNHQPVSIPYEECL